MIGELFGATCIVVYHSDSVLSSQTLVPAAAYRAVMWTVHLGHRLQYDAVHPQPPPDVSLTS